MLGARGLRPRTPDAESDTGSLAGGDLALTGCGDRESARTVLTHEQAPQVVLDTVALGIGPER